MAKDLTALAIEKEKPGSTRREIPDAKVRGLYFVVHPSGKRAWAFRYRAPPGQSRKLTIGGYPDITLEAARRHASRARAAVADGGDPAVTKSAEKSAAKQATLGATVKTAVDSYLLRRAKPKMRPTSYVEAARILNRELVQRFGSKPITAVRKSDIRDLLDEIVDRNAPIAANRSLATFRSFFNWSVERDLIVVSPCAGIGMPSPKVERERVLSYGEVAAIWHSASRLGFPFGPIIKLLILTAQRRSEVGDLMWAEIDTAAALWTLPRERAKNDKAHVTPLSKQALKILALIPIVDSNPRIFGRAGRPVGGWGAGKRRLDKLIAEDGHLLPAWTLHDLRRSAATHMASSGVQPHVLEAVLNHTGGTIRGVAKIYNRHTYAAEKAEALNGWGALVEKLVAGAVDNVIRLAEA